MATQTKECGFLAPSAIATAVALAYGTVAPGVVLAQEAENEEVVELGEFEVTGSRLSRADVEDGLPVTVIDRAQIEATGLPSTADVLRSLTFNSFGSFREISGSSFAGQAQISLRGLGADRTLVLVNGRRLAPSPVAGAGGADLNLIPIDAVERIEILTDGASAIYGSDAIGGVINVILRKNFSGTTLSASAGFPSRDGADEEGYSLLTGAANETGNLLIGASFSARNHIKLRDREYSSFVPGDGENLSTVRGANFVGNTLYGLESGQTFAPDSCAPDRVYTYDTIGEDSEACIFPFADIAYDTQDVDRRSLFAAGSQEIGSGHSLDFFATFSEVVAFGRFAPVADGVVLPPDAEANFTDETVLLFHRYEQLGPRDNETTNTLMDIDVSLSGDLFSLPYELGVRTSKYTGKNIGKNYTIRSIATEFLSDGTYNPYDLSQNSEETIGLMKFNPARESTYDFSEVYGNVTVPLFEMPAGLVQAVVGAEYRDDDYSDQYDPTSEAGNVGGTAGNSAAGGRTASAIFAETLLPVLDSLEIGAALRYDEYSDFGSEATGKLSARFQPLSNLVLRGSIGTGFRAPVLSDLYGALSQTAPTVRDFTQCRSEGISDADCPSTQVSTGPGIGGFIGSNPDLEAETSDQLSFGVATQPLDWLEVTLDYYDIKLENAVNFVSFQELIRREADGQALPPGTSITRADTGDGSVGRINRIVTGPANVATLETNGLDLNLRGNFSFGRFGGLTSNLQVSYVLEYVDSENKPGQDQVNDPGVPEYRAVLSNSYKVGSMAVNYNINYIDSTSAFTAPDGSGREIQQGHVASNTTHDIQVVWNASAATELTFGVRDMFDRGPSVNFELDNPYYDQTLYNPQGRVPYFGLKQRF